jgi:hypothetical protein
MRIWVSHHVTYLATIYLFACIVYDEQWDFPVPIPVPTNTPLSMWSPSLTLYTSVGESGAEGVLAYGHQNTCLIQD